MKWWMLTMVCLATACDVGKDDVAPLAPTAKPRPRVAQAGSATPQPEGENAGQKVEAPAKSEQEASKDEAQARDDASPDVSAAQPWRHTLEMHTGFEMHDGDHGVAGFIAVYQARLRFMTLRTRQVDGTVTIVAQLLGTDGVCVAQLDDGTPPEDFASTIKLPRATFLEAHLASQLRERLEALARAEGAPRDYDRLLRLVQFYSTAVIQKAIAAARS